MNSDWIIGALAFVTIGTVIFFALSHFGLLMKKPEHREAAKNIVAGGKSATTQVREEAPEGSYHDRPLKERLDGSHDSAHPHDPKLDNRPKI